LSSSQPIADMLPFCTVFFGDIAGYTAYSSTREPSQVLVLLETIYQVFDVLAKRRGVFKVETMSVPLTKARSISHALVFLALKRRHFCGGIGLAQS
jgi:class 3 adenylate cyclase